MPDAVIGLEIHLAVNSASKMFCGCSAQGFGKAPNAHTCPVCMGLPGSLPVANEAAIDKAILFALALECSVPEHTQFHRKNYFYPDAPKNYQISQYDRPIGEHGRVAIPGGRRIGITRCHLEEDAGRLVHPPYADHSLVDLNRAGAPLIEMVTEPDLRSPDEARAFLAEIRAIARALGVSEASPEEGKMRADVNVSLRRDDGRFGTKVEVKNLNSFKSVESALAFEIRRQERLLEEGRPIVQETRGWNEGGQKTVSQRGKEEAADYRYMPDPDLPPMRIDREWRERLLAEMPELPGQKRERYVALGVREAEAEQIAYEVATARFFDRAAEAYDGPAQAMANWLVSGVAGELNARGIGIDDAFLRPDGLASLQGLVDAGTISSQVAKDLLPEVIDGANPAELVRERGLERIADAGAVDALVDDVMNEHPDVVASARANPKAVNALLGRVMKASGGKADPALVRRVLDERLAEPTE